ncbi:hypothetical protein PMIN04_008181 [Paraphaeosphaeria minitans]
MTSRIQTAINERPLFVVAGTIGLVFATIAYHDYRHYCSLGPHGLPPTFWGWYTQLKMTRIARKDVTVPAPYDIDIVAGPHDKRALPAARCRACPEMATGEQSTADSKLRSSPATNERYR